MKTRRNLGKLLMVCILTATFSILTGCEKQIIGTWESVDQRGTTLTFNYDGTLVMTTVTIDNPIAMPPVGPPEIPVNGDVARPITDNNVASSGSADAKATSTHERRYTYTVDLYKEPGWIDVIQASPAGRVEGLVRFQNKGEVLEIAMGEFGAARPVEFKQGYYNIFRRK